MKNSLFVISTVFVPLLLISLNYSAIHDYYVYSIPLNSLVVEPSFYSNNPDQFQKTYEDEDSQCFTSPSMNFFCDAKPRMRGES